MTEKQIRLSIETGELRLGNRAKLKHYAVLGYLFIFPLVILSFHLYDYIKGNPRPIQEFEQRVVIIASIIGGLFYLLQKKRLAFRTVTTNLTRAELDSIIDNVANELKWFPHLVNEKVIIAKTHPSFFSGSWGEQITILFDHNRVLVNSICDPDEKSSVVSMGRNNRNMNRLIEEIHNASND